MSVNRTPNFSRLRWLLTALAACLNVASWPAYAGDFSLTNGAWADTPVFGSFDQFSLVPVTGARLEGQAHLNDRQELKFSTLSTGSYGLYGSYDSGPGALHLDNTVGLDQPRATYRYTWLSMRDLDLKVGLTSNLSPLSTSLLHSGLTSPLRFGSLPQMHLSGVGRLTSNWQLALDADGLWTARGRSLDLDLHLDYSLTRSVQVFGGYRMSDYVGDAEDFYGASTVNTANVGMRFRF